MRAGAAATLARLKGWARAQRRDVLALWLAYGDPRVPRLAKALALATAAYALSPIDLIPDFIPVIGYLDDLLIVPAAIALTIRLIPPPVMAALRDEAARRIATRPRAGLAGAALVVAVWVGLAALVLRAVMAP